jgi:hypothetical protein
VKHQEQAPCPVVDRIDRGRLRRAEDLSYESESFEVIYVEHPPDSSGQAVVVGFRWSIIKTGPPAQTGPSASAAAVDVIP